MRYYQVVSIKGSKVFHDVGNEREGSMKQCRGQIHDQERRESFLFEKEVISFSISFKYIDDLTLE